MFYKCLIGIAKHKKYEGFLSGLSLGQIVGAHWLTYSGYGYRAKIQQNL